MGRLHRLQLDFPLFEIRRYSNWASIETEIPDYCLFPSTQSAFEPAVTVLGLSKSCPGLICLRARGANGSCWTCVAYYASIVYRSPDADEMEDIWVMLSVNYPFGSDDDAADCFDGYLRSTGMRMQGGCWVRLWLYPVVGVGD